MHWTVDTLLFELQGSAEKSSFSGSASSLDLSNRASPIPLSVVGASVSGDVSPVMQYIPQLNDAQVAAIVASAESLAKELPKYELKPLTMKKENNREVMQVRGRISGVNILKYWPISMF